MFGITDSTLPLTPWGLPRSWSHVMAGVSQSLVLAMAQQRTIVTMEQ